MTSKTSYSSLGKNVRAQLHAMRSFILLLAVCYFTVGPLMLLFQTGLYAQSVSDLPLISSLFYHYYVPYYWLALGLGVIGGLYATRYQQVPSQSNFYHSLPICRKRLLGARVLALTLVQGLLLLAVVVANMVASLIMARGVADGMVGALFAGGCVHFAYIMLAFWFMLAVTLLAGQLTANIVGQTLMTVVFHVTLPLIGATLGGLVSVFSNTYSSGGWFSELTKWNIITPISRQLMDVKAQIDAVNPVLAEGNLYHFVQPATIAWPLFDTVAVVLLTILAFALTFVLYQRRAVEKAGDTLMYPRLGSLIKGIYVALGACVVALIFISMDMNLVGIALSVFIAMIVVHLIAEMLYSQDVDGVRGHFVSTLVGGAAALVVLGGLQSGVIDFDRSLPDAAHVKAATIVDYSATSDGVGLGALEASSDPALVEKVMTAAQEARDKNIVLEPEDDPSGTVTLCAMYETTFGTTRRYFTVGEDDARAILAPLAEDKNYQQSLSADLANAAAADIVDLSFNPSGLSAYLGGDDVVLLERYYSGSTSSQTLAQSEENAQRTKALIAAFQKDLAARTQETASGQVMGYLNYSLLTTRDGHKEIAWGNRCAIYAGDKATVALLNEWRDEGFIDSAADYDRTLLQGYKAERVQFHGDSYLSEGEMSLEDFINAWESGALVGSDSSVLHATPAQDEGVILYYENRPEEDDSYFSFYFSDDSNEE